MGYASVGVFFAFMASLNILVPAYNEERTILRVMDALTHALPDARVIYVDDGSKDETLSILRKHARPTDTVLTKENGGKGSAIRMAIANASADFCVIQDADLEYDPSEIAGLLEAAVSEPGTVVFGSRFLRKNPNIYPLFLLGNKTLTTILNLLFGGTLTDSYTCYKLFPTNVLKAMVLRADGFELEAELAAIPLKKGIRIIERAISYHPRSFAEGKKIGWRDAVKGIVTMLRIRMQSS